MWNEQRSYPEEVAGGVDVNVPESTGTRPGARSRSKELARAAGARYEKGGTFPNNLPVITTQEVHKVVPSGKGKSNSTCYRCGRSGHVASEDT